MQNYDYLYKLLLIGDSGVGKSSIVLRFADETFTENYISTIGVDFKIRTLDYKDKKIKLQIWDTAGQERFRTITTSYYRGAHGVIIVFDLTDLYSFLNIEDWIEMVTKYGNTNPQIILVGNKSDLIQDRKIDVNIIANLVNKFDLKYLETSAKNDTNICNIFESLVAKLLKNNYLLTYDYVDQSQRNIAFSTTKDIKKKLSGCC